jgi:hypothetical protein
MNAVNTFIVENQVYKFDEKLFTLAGASLAQRNSCHSITKALSLSRALPQPALRLPKRPGFPLIRARALGSGRYPLQSLTRNCLNLDLLDSRIALITLL